MLTMRAELRLIHASWPAADCAHRHRDSLRALGGPDLVA